MNTTQQRHVAERNRAWDLLGKLDGDSALWDTVLAKAYRLMVLAEGGAEAEATAQSARYMETWRELNRKPFRFDDWRTA